MWVVIGKKEKTERVPGGKAVERHCQECGETAMFYERKATSTLQLYFLDVYDFKSRTVMACGACGALYATDEVGSTASAPAEEPKGLNAVVGAAKAVGTAALSEAQKAFNEVRRAVTDEAPPRVAAQPPSDTDDPLRDEDDALEAQFKELERKVRIADK